MKDYLKTNRIFSLSLGIYRTFKLALFIAHHQWQYHNIYKTEILPLLSNLPHDLAGRRLRKRTKNYGTTIAGFFGPATLLMAGHKPTRADQRLLCFTGSSMPGFDACFDEDLVDTKRIQSILLDGHAPNDSPYEQLANILWTKLEELTPDHNYLRQLTRKIIEIQTQALIQTSSLDKAIIEKATREKGVAGALFFTLPLPKEKQEDLLPCITKLGAWAQLSDDLHDLRTDLLENNHTLISTANSIETIEQIYQEWALIALQSLPKNTPQSVKSGFLLYHYQNTTFIKHLKNLLKGSAPKEAINLPPEDYYAYKTKLISWKLLKALASHP